MIDLIAAVSAETMILLIKSTYFNPHIEVIIPIIIHINKPIII